MGGVLAMFINKVCFLLFEGILMERFSGFQQYGYCFEVVVPATIYDEKRAIVTAYKGRKLMDEISFPLQEQPRWNIPHQCIELAGKDMRTLEQKTRELVEKLL